MWPVEGIVRRVGPVAVVVYPLCIVRRFVGPCTVLGLTWKLVPGECGPVGPPVVWWWEVLGVGLGGTIISAGVVSMSVGELLRVWLLSVGGLGSGLLADVCG